MKNLLILIVLYFCLILFTSKKIMPILNVSYNPSVVDSGNLHLITLDPEQNLAPIDTTEIGILNNENNFSFDLVVNENEAYIFCINNFLQQDTLSCFNIDIKKGIGHGCGCNERIKNICFNHNGSSKCSESLMIE